MRNFLRAGAVLVVLLDFLTPALGANPGNGDDQWPKTAAHITNLPQLVPGGAIAIRPDTGITFQIAPTAVGGNTIGGVMLFDGFGVNPLTVNNNGSINTMIVPRGGVGAGGATVGTSSAMALPAARRSSLAIQNVSASGATVACADSATAALNTAGSWMISAGQILTWQGEGTPQGTINCISSIASTPTTMSQTVY